jgi:hypothetical protein
LVVADLPGDDLILCQITSQARADGCSIPLGEPDFARGRLTVSSFIRPNRLFTVESSVILYAAATVTGPSCRKSGPGYAHCLPELALAAPPDKRLTGRDGRPNSQPLPADLWRGRGHAGYRNAASPKPLRAGHARQYQGLTPSRRRTFYTASRMV